MFKSPLFALVASLGLQAQLIAQTGGEKRPTEDVVVLEKFVTTGGEDPKGLLPTGPSNTLFGLDKSLSETPRSITIMSSEMLDSFSINVLADMQKFSPGLYTTFNFGIQGSLAIRGDAADLYFRGVKRITNTSNIPTIIGASDGVDIVRGPPSPVYGNGQVGGYTNYLPRTARATTGKYIPRITGKSSVTLGSYGQKIGTLEFGGPLKLFGRQAGFYLYTYLEDSDSFYLTSLNRQQIGQGTLTVDLTKSLRLETGFQYQNHRGTGVAGWNRVTQELIDHGTYITGYPRVNLDTNGDGAVSYNEIIAGGDLNRTVPLGTKPALPPGFALDPATVGTVTLNPRRVLLERYLDTSDVIGFVDLINDADPDLTFSSKSLLEYTLHNKFSDITYFRHHEVTLVEQRFTVSHRPKALPDWLTFRNIVAANVRYLDTFNTTSSSQQVHSRIDLSGPLYPTLASGVLGNGLDTPDIGGVQTANRSRTAEYGVGLVSDITFFGKANLMMGARQDWVWGDFRQTVTNYRPASDNARGTDAGASYSGSFSYPLFKGIRAYASYGKQNTVIPGISGGLSNSTQVRNGAMSISDLKEAGFKTQFLKDKLFVTVAAYEQRRGSYNSLLDTFQFTRGEGLEIEARYVPNRHLNVSVGADWQRVDTDPLTPLTGQLVNAQFLGYDPAAAYGGRLTTTLPAIPRYSRKQGFPDHIFSLLGNYSFDSGWDVSLGATYQCKVFLSVLQDIVLPSALVWTSSVGYKARTWEVRLSGKNLTDERYFTGNGTNIVLVMPAIGRTVEGKITYKF